MIFGYVHEYKYALSLLVLSSYYTQAQLLAFVKLLPMRCILGLSLFLLVSIARCLTLAPEVLTDQISSSNNPGSSSHGYDLPGQGLSDIADANNDGCMTDGASTGKAAERRNLIARGKICRPPEEKKPAGAQLTPPPSKSPSKFNPDLPGHLDNLPESYPLLHLEPNELNLDEEICPPNIAGQRRYAFCDTGLSLDRIIHDTFEPRSWDLLRCEDCMSFVIDRYSLSLLTNFFLHLLVRAANLAFEATVNPITGCFFGYGGFQSSVWCCHEQTTSQDNFFGQVRLKFILFGPFE